MLDAVTITIDMSYARSQHDISIFRSTRRYLTIGYASERIASLAGKTRDQKDDTHP